MIKKIKSFFKKWKETNKLQREIEREEKIERLKKNKLYGDYDEQDDETIDDWYDQAKELDLFIMEDLK